jgi:ATP phosphoribosyltransferase regulatory subunit
VEAKDAQGIRRALSGVDLPQDRREALERLATLAGGPDVLLDAAEVVADCPAAAEALGELRTVWEALDRAGLGSCLAVDLGEVRGLDYYTGLVFRVFAPGLGFEVGGGGRYDTLLGRFGRPLPAVGFMLGLDRVALLLARQKGEPAPPPEPVHPVADADLGSALAEARLKRDKGVRVRLDKHDGGDP